MSEANGAQPAAAEDVNKLKEKNDSLYAESVHLKKELEKYTKLGVIDDLRGKLDHYDNLRKETAKTPEEITKLLADKEKELGSRFSNKLTEHEQTITSLTSKVQKYEVVTPTMQKAASLFVDTSLDLVNMLVEKDLASVDGQIIVKGQDGKPLPSAKDPRKDMGVDEYLENIAAKYPSIAKAKTLSTGKEPGSTSGAVAYTGALPTREQLLSMSPKEIESKGLNHDQLKQIMG